MHEEQEDVGSFEDLGLDDRILKAIAKLGWVKPTLIQDKAITLALEGKDVLARARTGSGKTGAYVIPIVQKILKSKQTAKEQCTKAIILAPTKELCNQAHRNIREMCMSCSREVRSVDVSGQASLDSHKPLLMEKPDIIVGTPSKILAHIKAGNIDLKSSVEMVAVDEADLLFSFGHEKDMKELLLHLPEVYQAILMSATLSEDAKALKTMVLNNPVILKLEQSQLPSSDRLKQFKIMSDEDDKFLVLYALLKLHLLHGKMIIFVNSVDRCYKLKLYFEQFSIPACVLNSELPVASRCNIVGKFNEGRYDIIIAADEKFMTSNTKSGKQLAKKKFNLIKDSESGVSRGIDFRNVTTIINFDFPLTVESYIHRVGRTARADSKGMALNLVCGKEMDRLKEVESFFKESHPEGLANFKFDMEEASSLRYRSDTARRSITRDIIREARRKEIKEEMLNSKKLKEMLDYLLSLQQQQFLVAITIFPRAIKAYFEDNPRDLQVLKHDKTLRVVKIHSHLKNVPDYLVPPSLQSCAKYRPGTIKRDNSWNSSKKNFSSKGHLRHKRKQADPLMSFKFEPKNKKRKITK